MKVLSHAALFPFLLHLSLGITPAISTDPNPIHIELSGLQKSTKIVHSIAFHHYNIHSPIALKIMLLCFQFTLPPSFYRKIHFALIIHLISLLKFLSRNISLLVLLLLRDYFILQQAHKFQKL